MLKNIDRYLKNFKKDLDKLQKYQYNITYGLDYLFNEKYYYKPTEVKSAFDGSYILYESKGDKDSKLAIYKYFDMKDLIDDHKAKGEWKIQLTMRIIFVSFKDENETRERHTESNNITIMSGIETDDAINEHFP